jgi:hypothetical protein
MVYTQKSRDGKNEKLVNIPCAHDKEMGKLVITSDVMIFWSILGEKYDVCVPIEIITSVNKGLFRKQLIIKSIHSKWKFTHVEADLDSIISKMKAAMIQRMFSK